MTFHLGKLKFQQRANFLPLSHWDIKLVKEKVSLPASCVQMFKSFDADCIHKTAHNHFPSPKLFSDLKTLISRLMLTTARDKHNIGMKYCFSKSNLTLQKLHCLGFNQLMIMSAKRDYCNLVGNTSQKKERRKDKSNIQTGPSQENLAKIQEKLKLLVMDMFRNRHDYGALHKDVIMENNLFGSEKKRIGVMGYAVELMKLRMRIHFRYPGAFCVVEDIKLLEESNSVIRIHWKLQGVPQKHIVKFWRLQDVVERSDMECLDGYSYFHIGSDGLIHKHRLERVPLRLKNTDKSEEKKDHSVPFLG